MGQAADVAVAGVVVIMGLLHSQDPRSFGVKGPREGKQYFYPSEAITVSGKFIPAQSDDGRLLPEMSSRCLPGVVSLSPSFQLVQ